MIEQRGKMSVYKLIIKIRKIKLKYDINIKNNFLF